MTGDLGGNVYGNDEDGTDEPKDINGVIVGFGTAHDHTHPLADLFILIVNECSYTINHEGVKR